MPEKEDQNSEPTLFDALHQQLSSATPATPAAAPTPAPAVVSPPAAPAPPAPAALAPPPPSADAPPPEPAQPPTAASADKPLPDQPPAAETTQVGKPAEGPPTPVADLAPKTGEVLGAIPEPAAISLSATAPAAPGVEPPFAAPPIRRRPAANPAVRSGAWWTIPLLCIGISMIACAMILGQVETNRQLAWQRNKLQRDYDHLQRQIKVNEEFLTRIQKDPTLAERLAQRQTKEVRQGTAVLSVPALGKQDERNPFSLVTIAPPPPLKPYEPRSSLLVWICGSEQRRLWITAAGLLLVAAGLVLGGAEEKPTRGRA